MDAGSVGPPGVSAGTAEFGSAAAAVSVGPPPESELALPPGPSMAPAAWLLARCRPLPSLADPDGWPPSDPTAGVATEVAATGEVAGRAARAGVAGVAGVAGIAPVAGAAGVAGVAGIARVARDAGSAGLVSAAREAGSAGVAGVVRTARVARTTPSESVRGAAEDELVA
jgi:hypothetical protein